jgi:hypothetical protein
MPGLTTLLRSGSWGPKLPSRSPSPAPAPTDEPTMLANALAAADLLVNDDIDGSIALLRASPESAYTDLGKSIIAFMQAVMGFEPELMREAVERTRVCEKTSQREWQAALARHAEESRQGGGGGGKHASQQQPSFATWTPTPERFYPPGSGFAVINAAAQLMHGATGVLDESDKLEKLGAAVKAFFKLRKAYGTLHDVIEFEARVTTPVDPDAERKRKAVLAASMRDARMPGGFDDDDVDDLLAVQMPQDGFVTAAAAPPEMEFGMLSVSSSGRAVQQQQPPRSPHSRNSSTSSSLSAAMPPTPPDHAPLAAAATGLPPSATTASPLDALTDPMDLFVHAASNLAFGALQLILGMCPPAYRSLLSVVGFRGSRERGLAMLWRASTYPNFCGALAGLILLAYYTGLASFSDILPAARDADERTAIIGYPEERCAGLLADIRARYPQSLIWRLVEGRVLGDQRRMAQAIRVLQAGPESNLRQITALTHWQLALNASYVRDWNLTRDSFLRCVELNDWTHAYYYYHAACAELELYRDAVARRAPRDECLRHKDAAEALFRKAPPLAGHRRLLTKRIPHEVFVERRVARWEQRAREMGVDLADAIGVSPAHELAYVWNGTKKLTEHEARASLADLRWERCTAPRGGVEKLASLPEEVAVRALVVAALLRRLGRFDEARRMLQEKALCFDK